MPIITSKLPSRPGVGIMEMEPDIESMTLNEYLKYEAEKERRSKRMSPNKSDEVNIDNMIIAEYELYIAKHDPMNNPLNDHSYSFTSNFCDQSPCTPNPQPDDKELSFEKAIDDWQLLTPSVHALPEPKPVVQPCVPLLPSPDEVMVVRDKEPNNDVNRISIQLLEEFRDEILNVTVVDEEADCNPTKGMEELERFLAKDTQSYFTDIQRNGNNGVLRQSTTIKI
ncbi:hypothetical protein Tco_0422519 [Tanacetum coccineum]